MKRLPEFVRMCDQDVEVLGLKGQNQLAGGRAIGPDAVNEDDASFGLLVHVICLSLGSKSQFTLART